MFFLSKLDRKDWSPPALLREWPCLSFCFAVLLLFRFVLLFRLNIHWDEFFFLSRVFDLKQGRLSGILQTFHSWLYLPLAYLPFEETTLVVCGRILSYAVSVAALGGLYSILAPVFGRPAILCALFIWCAVPESIVFGSSFRADPLALFFVVFALRAARPEVLSPKLAAVSGALLALSVMISLKSLLILAVLLPLIVRSPENVILPLRVRSVFLVMNAFLISLVLLLSFHSSFVVERNDLALGAESGSLVAYGKQLLTEFLRFDAIGNTFNSLKRSLIGAIFFWALFFPLGFFVIRKKACPLQLTVSLGIAAGIGLCYRNVFSYFLPIILLPWAVLAGLGWRQLTEFSPRGQYLLPVLITVSGLWSGISWWGMTMENQREFLSSIHRIYGSPVPYIDRSGMVSSFPKVGPFLSGLIIERYRQSDHPVFPALLSEQNPQFLVENSSALSLDTDPGSSPLLEADRKALVSAFPYRYGKLRSVVPIQDDLAQKLVKASERPLFAVRY